MLIDSHAHLNFKAFDNDFDQVVERCLADNVWMVNVGSKYDTSRKAVDIAGKYDKGVFAAVGLHPIHVRDEEFDKEKYKELCVLGKVVAIGETGLDYFKDYGEFKEKQKKVFVSHLELAKELGLPVIIHCRMAHKDLIEILSDYKISGVVHCFTGTWSEAKRYLNTGFYIGINGIIYKMNLKEVIKKTPLDRILVETDCPYLTPLIPSLCIDEEKKEYVRNEPCFVKYVAEEVSRIKNIDFNIVVEATTKNTQKLFAIS